MPIYPYKCSACAHQFDALQKISDAPLTVCPSCGAPALAKQLTAAGFQLKGSGWYATDFKNGGAKAVPDADKSDADKSAAAAGDKAADKPADKPAAPAADGAAPAAKDAPAAPAAAGGSGAGAATP
jgi:putative FmdB family regulatory protein